MASFQHPSQKRKQTDDGPPGQKPPKRTNRRELDGDDLQKLTVDARARYEKAESRLVAAQAQMAVYTARLIEAGATEEGLAIFLSGSAPEPAPVAKADPPSSKEASGNAEETAVADPSTLEEAESVPTPTPSNSSEFARGDGKGKEARNGTKTKTTYADVAKEHQPRDDPWADRSEDDDEQPHQKPRTFGAPRDVPIRSGPPARVHEANACTDYVLKGKCARGEACWYQHRLTFGIRHNQRFLTMVKEGTLPARTKRELDDVLHKEKMASDKANAGR